MPADRIPDEESPLVRVALPTDLADALLAVAGQLSAELGHRVPLPVLRRALVIGGLRHRDQVLSELRAALAEEAAP